MENKKQKFTESLRKNPWKTGTLVLSVTLILIIAYNLTIEPALIEKSEAERLCSTIEATPAWINSNGRIISYGLKNVSGIVDELLIPERVKLVYHSDCGACKKQIEYFGDDWEIYVNEGLTVDCKNVE